MDDLLRIFGVVGIAVSGLAGVSGLAFIVYKGFQHLAVKWLDAKFAERLQALKHMQDKEMEQLRFKIAAMLDRTVKLHQREFDVLPEAWSKLNDAFWVARSFVSPAQSYPDLERMSAPHREEFIAGTSLLESQKAELRNAEKKNDLYQKQIFWHNLANAQSKGRESFRWAMKNGIFISEDIRAKFAVLHDLIFNALSEHQMNVEHAVRPVPREDIDRLLSSATEDLMKNLEKIIHQRLWPVADVTPG